jgi:hypothetical protein
MISRLRKSIKEIGARLEQSDLGTPQPALRWVGVHGLSQRQAKAISHRLAALVEEHSEQEGWIVNLGHVGHWRGLLTGSVQLELCEASDDEVKKGMAVLEHVASLVLNTRVH